MERATPGQTSFMGTELAGFASNLQWHPGQGWRLWVTSWRADETPGRGHQATYTHLTADEALDVLAAEQATRCDWLHD